MLTSVSPEEARACIERRRVRRKQRGGKIVVDELVPDGVLNSLMKLYNECDIRMHNHDLEYYYPKCEDGRILKMVCLYCNHSHYYKAIPAIILTDYITVNRRLHIREPEYEEFVTSLDLYLDHIRKVEHVQRNNNGENHPGFENTDYLPVTLNEIIDIIHFLYGVMDKRETEHKKIFLDELFIRWNLF